MSIQRQTLSGWWLLCLVPIVALLVPVVTWYATERRATTEIRQHLAALQNAGQPIDVESLMQSFYDRTTRNYAIAWGELVYPIGAVNRAGFDSGVKEYEDVKSSSSWRPHIVRKISLHGDGRRVEEVSKRLSEQSRALFDRIRQIAPDDRPVWLPMVPEYPLFRFAPLGALWGSDDLLMSEVELSFQQNNRDRSVEMLKLHEDVMDKFDWQTTVRGEVERATILLYRNAYLLRTLDNRDNWNAEHVSALMKLLEPEMNLASRWRSVISTERAFALEAVGASDVGTAGNVDSNDRYGEPKKFIEIPATLLLTHIRDLDACMAIADDGFASLGATASSVENRSTIHRQIQRYGLNSSDEEKWNEALKLHFPKVRELAQTLVSIEDSRRFTLAALAVKKFQLDIGDWPEKLTDTKITPSELMDVDGQAFEYSRDKSGEYAVLGVGKDTYRIR